MESPVPYFIGTRTSHCYLLFHCVRPYSQRHLCKNEGSVWQFDKLLHSQETVPQVPEWSYGNWEWTVRRMTEHDQWRFNRTVRALIEENGFITVAEYKRYFQGVACVVFLCRMEQSSKSSEFASTWEKLVQDGVQNLLDNEYKWNRVPTGLVMSCYHAKEEDLFDQTVTWEQEMSPSFHTQDEKCFEAVGSKRWQSYGESKARKISPRSSSHGILGQRRQTVAGIRPKRCQWKWQSITTFKNWTKIFILLAFQSNWTTMKNILFTSVTM